MNENGEIQLPRAKMQRWELSKLVPNAMAGSYTHQYFDYLATTFKDDVISPPEFWLRARLAFTDLRNGTDAFTGRPIMHEAADRVPAMEMFIRRDIPRVIDVIFSAEDAAALKKCKEEVDAEAAALAPALAAARRKEQEQMVDAHLTAINTPAAKSKPATAARSKPKKPKAKKARKTRKKTQKTAKKKK